MGARRRLFLLLAVLLFRPQPARAQFRGCEVIQQVSRDECEALVNLFDATGGLTWFNSRGWLETNQPCDWHGVVCAPGAWPRHVIRIRLPSNNLGGSLPGDLARLTHLRELVVENRASAGQFNVLTGGIPIELWQLTELEVLDLGHNDLGNTIPEELGRLRKLRILALDGNRLEGSLPTELGDLSELARLDLGRNRLGGPIPPVLGRLDNLTHLLLNDNLFTGSIPPELGDLRRLTRLDLSRNDLSGDLPPSLEALPALNWLSVAGNRLSGPVPPAVAARLANLSACFLDDNAGLCLPDTPLYRTLGDGLCRLSLDAACSRCTTVGEISDAACRGLEALYNDTGGPAWARDAGWLTSDTPCRWYGVGCTDGRVTALELPQNDLEGPLSPSLSALQGLVTLDLSGNRLTGPIPPELGELRGLVTLDLSGNRLVGAVPASVAALGAAAGTCRLAGNDLCLPAAPPFLAFGGVCDLALDAACLPGRLVEIVSFDARPEETDVVLSWQTARPADGIRFEVEQRTGAGYRVLSTVEAVPQRTVYAFRATGLTPGFHTFRLKQVDPTGAFRYSPEVDVALVTGAVTLEPAYPNPFRSGATFRFAVQTSRAVVVALYSPVGRRVRTLYAGTPPARTPQTVHLDATGLAGGLYLIRLTGDGGITASSTIVLLR